MVPFQSFLDYLISSNTRVLGSMMFHNSPGHVVFELDNFLRMRHLGELGAQGNFLAVFAQSELSIPTHIANTCPGVFSPASGLQILVDNECYRHVLEIEALYPELVVDVGLSHLKIALHDAQSRKAARLMRLAGWPKELIWVITNQQMAELNRRYLRRQAESHDYCPWATIPEPSPALQQLLGGNWDKLALVHHKPVAYNNSGTVVESTALHPTLAYLRDMGYTIVKIGTEEFPPEWSHYGVIPYAASGIMNYGHDLMLIKAAKFAMYHASGASHVAELLGTPMVSYAGWHLNYPPLVANCVHLPTLMRRKSDRRILRFAEQIDCLENLPEFWEGGGFVKFPHADYEQVSPTADLILAAAQESIDLGANPVPHTPDQARFNSLSRHKYYTHTQSRICQKLLDKFPAALDSGFDAD